MTTTNLKTPTPRAWLDLPTPVACTICVFALLLIAALVGRIKSEPTIVVAPTPAVAQPIIVFATPAAPTVAPAPPTAAPAQVAAVLPGTTLRGAVVAYGAPEGNVLGAIEAGRAYQLLARWGSDWLQADVAGSGVVWLRASDVLDLPADLADLEPQPTAVIVERPAVVIYQPAAAPIELAAPTPEPEPYQAASAPNDRTAAQEAERQQNIRRRLVNPPAAP